MDSYNSQYPLEYYEVGTPYMFYVGKSNSNRKAASMEVINKYGPVLKKTQAQKGGERIGNRRAVGVVTEKIPVDPKFGTGAIEVLFQGVADGKTVYMTTKYITNWKGSFHDDDESVSAAGILDMTGEVHVTAVGKNGGIDLDGGRSGGIDLDGGNRTGGIDLG